MVIEFKVDNYRNVSVEHIALSRINLLIGPNGSGKSNFLKALGFWAKVVQNRQSMDNGITGLHKTLSQSGWHRMLNFEADSNLVSFSWVFQPEEARNPYEYKLILHMGGGTNNQLDYYVASEYLAYAKPENLQQKTPYVFFTCHEDVAGKGLFTTGTSGRSRVNLPVRNNEIALLQLSELRNADKEFDDNYRNVYADRMDELQKYLMRFFSYSCSEFDIKQLKKPARTSHASFLSSNASNLTNLVYQWKQNEYNTTFSAYRQMISPLFGEVYPVELYIDPVSQTNDAQLIIGVNKHQYLLDDLSDGTIRAMIMAALMVDKKEKMSVCTIDEPEMNLHPEWQSRFTDWLLTSNASQQFFISTHSPEILDPLTSAFMNNELKVFVFSDEPSIAELSPSRIIDLYGKGFNLGDLYRAKAIEIGGWPK